MSIVSSQAVGRQATNNAFISKLSYATDLDYQNAQPNFLVNFPDTSRAHIYYNTTLKVFRYHDGTNWKNLNTSSISSSPTSPVLPLISDLWFNTSDNSLNFWDGSAWVNISANPASNKAYFHATINPTGQSIPAQATNATSVKVVWNSVIEDNESKWNVANNQYEIPRDGKYLITAMLRTQGTTSGADVSAFASVFLNNSLHKEFLVESISFSGALPAPNIGVRLIGSILLNLNQNDLIDIRVFMSNAVWSGVTLQTTQPSAHFDFKIIEL